jgi:chitodextrinase
MLASAAMAKPKTSFALVSPTTSDVSGLVNVRTRVAGGVGKHALKYAIDGKVLKKAQSRSAKAAWRIDTRTLTNGRHKLTITARFSLRGRTRTLRIVRTFTVLNRVKPPSDEPTQVQLGYSLIASAVGASESAIDLSWTLGGASLRNPSFVVTRAGLRLGSTNSTSFRATALACSTTYAFEITALDAAGNVAAAGSASAKTQNCPDRVPPSPPVGLATSLVTGSTLTLAWTPATDNIGVAFYRVRVDGVAVGTTVLPQLAVSGLICEWNHTLTVEAEDAVGNRATSQPLLAETGSCPTPSGVPMPAGNLPGWKLVFAENFRVNAPTGSWGSETDANKIVYTGSRGTQWVTYPRSYLDTYDKRPYRSDEVLSVHDDALDFHLHEVDGLPAGANPSPVMPDGTLYQTYGRYTARMKVENVDLSGYYVAWLLWPKTEADWESAESDFPEQSLVPGITGAVGVSHFGPNKQQEVFITPGIDLHEWHTFTQDWEPGLRRYYIDDQLVYTTINPTYSGPQRWQLQTETKGDAGGDGHLLIDWAAVYEYAP